MSSGNIPPKDEPDPDEILWALREGIFETPGLRELSSEEVARELVLEGRLQGEPSPTLVADMLQALEAEEGAFDGEELSEEGNPT